MYRSCNNKREDTEEGGKVSIGMRQGGGGGSPVGVCVGGGGKEREGGWGGHQSGRSRALSVLLRRLGVLSRHDRIDESLFEHRPGA